MSNIFLMLKNMYLKIKHQNVEQTEWNFFLLRLKWNFSLMPKTHIFVDPCTLFFNNKNTNVYNSILKHHVCVCVVYVCVCHVCALFFLFWLPFKWKKLLLQICLNLMCIECGFTRCESEQFLVVVVVTYLLTSL